MYETDVLIPGSFKVHRCDSVLSALADMGTAVTFVLGECTGAAQQLDVGVMVQTPLSEKNNRVSCHFAFEIAAELAFGLSKLVTKHDRLFV